MNETSFWSARLQLPANRTSTGTSLSASGFWDNPDGNPTPPPSNYTSPWRRAAAPQISHTYTARQDSGPGVLYTYTEPIQYPVRKTGYYCVGELVILRRIVCSLDLAIAPQHSYLSQFRL